MSQLIQEAFQELKTLNEDIFSYNKEGILDLSKFLNLDLESPTYSIIDPEAEQEEDLQASYVGKAILDCNVCHQLMYKDPAEIFIDEETGSANVGEECPHCCSVDGFKVVGQINPYVDEDEVKVTVDDDEVEVKEKADTLEESLNEDQREEAHQFESLLRGREVTFTGISYEDAGLDVEEDGEEIEWFESITNMTGVIDSCAVDDGFEEDCLMKESFEDCYWNVLLDNGEKLHGISGLSLKLEAPLPSVTWNEYKSLNEDTAKKNGKWVNKGKDGTHGSFKTKKAADAQRKALFVNGYTEPLTEAVRKSIPAPFDKYFKVMTEEEACEDAGVDDWIEISAEGLEGYNAKHVAFIRAKDKYADTLGDDGLEFLEVVTEDGETFIAQVVNGRLYDASDDILDCLDAEPLTEVVKEKTTYKVEHREDEDVEWQDEGSVSTDDIIKYMDEFAEWLDEEAAAPHWMYDEDELIVYDGYGQEYRFIPTEGKDLTEEFQKATVETGESVLSMESDESGKITVTSEPRKIEESGEEMIAPLEDSTKTMIEINSEEDDEDLVGLVDVDGETEVEGEVGDSVDVDVEEIDESEFDELGESYLKEVYDNVKSFRTTRGSKNEDRIKLEGLLTFKSGKQVKTSFVFEGQEITKRGKIKLLGENLQLSTKKNAFTLVGQLSNKKLCLESLTYNYSAKDSKTGSTTRLYGTIRRK